MLKFFNKKSVQEKIPDNFLIKCKSCEKSSISKILEESYYVCPYCGNNLPRTAPQIILAIADTGTFEEMYKVKTIPNPLNMPKYKEKQKTLRKINEIDEAVICGICKVEGEKVAIAVMDTRYLMGSLGTKTGEKITQLIEYATKKKLPLIIFTASGGARMQEGILSLMQMAKVTNAIKEHSNKGLFYMPILMNPTTGGVSASFAQLGDIIIAEDRSLICFAGPKVIERTIQQKLPEGFQTAEFLLEKGFLDKIVKRKEQRQFISQMLKIHKGKKWKS